MPHVGKPYARKSTRFRVKQARRRVNKPVVAKLKRATRSKTTRTGQNRSAIYTLSRQVRTLQFKDYGDRQYQAQFATLRMNDNVSPLRDNPICFCANSMYAGTSMGGTELFRGTVPPSAPPGTPMMPTFLAVENFEKATYDAGLLPQFQWNPFNNQNTVSGLEYMPVYAKYYFRWSTSILSQAAPIKLRITFFKFKRPMTANSAHFSTLPNACGAYRRLCTDDYRLRNYLPNNTIVVSDQTINVNGLQGQDAPAASAEAVVRYASVKLSFDKLLKPNIMNPGVIEDQNFYRGVPIQDQIWCVISTNCLVSAAVGSIQISRHLCWRDKHGTTTV